MTDQVSSIGEPMDQDELGDPSDNANSPDPLIGEEPKSGALSRVGSKNDQMDRVTQSRGAMADLRSQYNSAAGQAGDAYAQQKKALEDATQRLLSMQAGPSDKEAAYRIAAAVGTGGSDGRYNPAGINAAHAQILQEQREAEMAKQQLMAQYGMQIPQASIGAANARMGQLTQQMRIQQSDINNGENAANKAPPAPKALGTTGQVWNPTGGDQGQGAWEFHQEIADAANNQKLLQQKNAAALKVATAKAVSGGPMDDDTINFMADKFITDGKLPPGLAKSGNVVPILQRVQQRATANGDNASAMIANQQMTQAAAAMLKDYQTGKTHTQLDGLNTAVSHLNVYKPLIDQLNNGNVSMLNNAGNWWNKNIMGSPAPTDFNGVKAFVAGEIAKAVLPGGGGEAERQELAQSASSANSPQALKSIADKWQQLLAGKTHFAKYNWDSGTQGKYGAFEDKFLMPETKAALGIQSPKPQIVQQQPAAAALLNKWAPKPAAAAP